MWAEIGGRMKIGRQQNDRKLKRVCMVVGCVRQLRVTEKEKQKECWSEWVTMGNMEL